MAMFMVVLNVFLINTIANIIISTIIPTNIIANCQHETTYCHDDLLSKI